MNLSKDVRRGNNTFKGFYMIWQTFWMFVDIQLHQQLTVKRNKFLSLSSTPISNLHGIVYFIYYCTLHCALCIFCIQSIFDAIGSEWQGMTSHKHAIWGIKQAFKLLRWLRKWYQSKVSVTRKITLLLLLGSHLYIYVCEHELDVECRGVMMILFWF